MHLIPKNDDSQTRTFISHLLEGFQNDDELDQFKQSLNTIGITYNQYFTVVTGRSQIQIQSVSQDPCKWLKRNN